MAFEEFDVFGDVEFVLATVSHQVSVEDVVTLDQHTRHMAEKTTQKPLHSLLYTEMCQSNEQFSRLVSRSSVGNLQNFHQQLDNLH